MASGGENRSEKPTARRLLKAREKGQVARSRELPAAAVLLGMLLILVYSGQTIMGVLQAIMREVFKLHMPGDLTPNYCTALAIRLGYALAPSVGLVLLGGLFFSVAANMVQGGLTVSWSALGFHMERLSPKNGLSRIFSKNGWFEIFKGVATIAAVSIISYQVIARNMTVYPRLVLADARGLFEWTASVSYDVLLRVSILLVIVALVDYGFQKYRFLEQMKMTKQEIKEEFKEVEGDPITKGRIRRVQREMARKRMMADVPKADVIITNPTHYAVALSYKLNSMEAPKVVAKGVGFLAQRIKELAQQHDIPLVENKPLARTLFKTVEIGQYIPPNLYKAVAEILAYIYKARKAWSR